IMICRQCQYGVWPAEIERHLKRQHQLSEKTVRPIIETIQQWTELAPNRESIQIPHILDDPVPIVPCHFNGFQCQRNLPINQTCDFIASTERALRLHWREIHQWSQFERRGQVSYKQRAVREAEFQRSFQRVSYQRVFPSRENSHYIHIRFPHGRQSPPPPPDQAQQAVDAVWAAWEQAQVQQAHQPIEPDEIHDANPWLRRTGWPKLLQGITGPDLLRSVATPEPDPMDPIEQGVQVLWETVDQLARRSQRTVQHCGAAIRMEAVRTQAGQLPYQPLLAYMDESSVQKHVQPWQQVLAFIARTQQPHDWGSPAYDFTPRQRRKWDHLWELIQQPEIPIAQDLDETLRPWIMQPREQACLEFCVELLNQRPRTHEYESVLMCAMAVLGRSETGWRDPESYPPIISRVIKIARFMVVQKALWLDPAVPHIIEMWQKKQTGVSWALISADDELDDIDEGYITSISRSASFSPTLGFQAGSPIRVTNSNPNSILGFQAGSPIRVTNSDPSPTLGFQAGSPIRATNSNPNSILGFQAGRATDRHPNPISGFEAGRVRVTATDRDPNPVSGFEAGRVRVTATDRDPNPISGFEAGRVRVTATDRDPNPISGFEAGRVRVTATDRYPIGLSGLDRGRTPPSSGADTKIDRPPEISPALNRPSQSGPTTQPCMTRRSFQDQLERMVHRFMIRGTHGPIETLLDWRTYGLKVHYNTTAPGHVTWMNEDRLLYKDISFTMGDFRGLIHGLVTSTRNELNGLLYQSTQPLPSIPWDQLYDDPTQSQPGWSFLQDTRTPWPVQGSRWMIDRVRAEPAIQRDFIRIHRFHPPKIQSYFHRVARFKEQLAILLHITAGQPARIPELLSIQHMNIETSIRRNIFVDDGIVTLVTAYHKGFYASNDVKIIHRYVPREVGELIIYYLWLVLPFVEQLGVWQDQQNQSQQGQSQQGQSQQGQSQQGQSQQGQSQQGQSQQGQSQQNQSQQGQSQQNQQGQSRLTTHQRALFWGPDPGTHRLWTSDRFREILKRETHARLGKAINIPAYRDIAIGISRRFMRPSSQFPQNQRETREADPAMLDADNEAEMDPEAWIGHIADLQAAHSSHVAGMIYGRNIMEQAGTTAHRQAMFRLSSTDWHRFLGFESETPSETGKRKRAPWEEAATEQQIQRRYRLQKARMEQAMQRMTQKAAIQLRGVQGPVLQAIQQGESPVVAIMPTGSGKSMLFMLPAWIEPGGTTVVVVPLIALRQDMQQRCQQLGISCTSQQGQSQQGQSQQGQSQQNQSQQGQSQQNQQGQSRLTTHQRALFWGPDPGTHRLWTSDRFREILKRETHARLGKAINIPAYRDIAIGISRRFMRPSSQFPQNQRETREADPAMLDADNEAEMDPEAWIGHIADLQAAHSSHVAGMIYGRNIMEQAGTTAHRQAMFRLSSTDWHRFLGFESETPSETGKRKRAPWEEAATEQQIQRRYRLQKARMEQAMQRMTQKAAIQLRGVQGPVLQAIQQGESPVVAIMPTGSGKSMLFMLPAWIEPGGTTVVVVPLIALRQDMQQRCQQLGISCTVWESRRPPDAASIILVTPESAITPDFHSFLNRLQMTQRLDRIVIDECHVILQGSSTFRPAMQRLGQLIQARTQMVFLTATLPPRYEKMFFERIQHAQDSVRIFRARTSRTNIQYRVWRPIMGPTVGRGPHQWIETPVVQAFIRQQLAAVHRGKVIIYANIISQVTAVAQQFGCEAYYSQSIDRPGVLQRFMDGRQSVIAATSALGMGVDIPDIRCIIHIGTPRTLLDYAQESGRAGRDGQSSQAIIIQPAGWDSMAPWMEGVPEDEIQQVQQYMEARCRRQVLDRYLDGWVDGQQRQDCHDEI
ncbi:hypothetical protein FE257_006232, partial [Aspergillus nanangensis]